MTNSNMHSTLNRLLAIDAATCLAMGAALLLGSRPVAAVTQIPAGLLFWAGASLMPIAAFMAVTSQFSPVPRWASTLVISGNLLWAVTSILLPIAGLIAPTALGWAFLITQASVVAILAKLELAALRTPMIAA